MFAWTRQTSSLSLLCWVMRLYAVGDSLMLRYANTLQVQQNQIYIVENFRFFIKAVKTTIRFCFQSFILQWIFKFQCQLIGSGPFVIQFHIGYRKTQDTKSGQSDFVLLLDFSLAFTLNSTCGARTLRMTGLIFSIKSIWWRYRFGFSCLLFWWFTLTDQSFG